MCQAKGFSEESLSRLFYHSFTTSIRISLLEKADSDERYRFLLIFLYSDYQPSVPVVVMIWMDG